LIGIMAIFAGWYNKWNQQNKKNAQLISDKYQLNINVENDRELMKFRDNINSPNFNEEDKQFIWNLYFYKMIFKKSFQYSGFIAIMSTMYVITYTDGNDYSGITAALGMGLFFSFMLFLSYLLAFIDGKIGIPEGWS